MDADVPMIAQIDSNSEDSDNGPQPQPRPQPNSVEIPQNDLAKSENIIKSSTSYMSTISTANPVAVDLSDNNGEAIPVSTSAASLNFLVTHAHVPTSTEVTDQRMNGGVECVGTDSSLNGFVSNLNNSITSVSNLNNSITSATHHHQQQQQQVLTHRLVPMAPAADASQGYYISVPTHQGRNNAQPVAPAKSSSGRRSIHLRMVEDENSDSLKADENPKKHVRKNSTFLGAISLPRVIGMEPVAEGQSQTNNVRTPRDFGTIIVSWYEGTSSAELQEHVRNLVCRKLGKQVDDIRLLDEGCIPHEEVVLTPYIPDGTRLMVKFSIRPTTPTKTILRFSSPAPDSPSRAPTPYTSEGDLSVSGRRQRKLPPPLPLLPLMKKAKSKRRRKKSIDGSEGSNDSGYNSDSRTSSSLDDDENSLDNHDNKEKGQNGNRDSFRSNGNGKSSRRKSRHKSPTKSGSNVSEHSNSKNRSPKIIYRNATKTEERKHVVFVLANYFVLFLSLISIFAELHNRGPRWMEQLDERTNRVHACAVDSDALYKCIQEGDVSGLLASFALWIAKNNKLTTRFFLFGFDSAQKLWTVVYEALVTSFCWGTSYMFIRRGMNPDTRVNFLEKYWKDAIYGSLAGFNAAFMKAVLKNLIPKEVIEDVLDKPNIRILDIFKAFAV